MPGKSRLQWLIRGLFAIAIFISSCNILSHLQSPATSVPATLPGQPSPVASETAPPATAVPTPPFATSQGPRFATYEESPGDVSPLVHHEKIAVDLSNVQNAFVLSRPQIERLAQNGFVVSPGVEKEFFALYEKMRYDNLPIFVTSDSLLHSYHLLFDKVLRTAETERFIPMLNRLNQAMLSQTDVQYQALRGTTWEDAARRTVAYFGVGTKLLAPDAQIPDYASDLVQAELSLIEQAGGIFPSPIFPGLQFGEDYTQYIPRGHYTKSDDLKRYFKSMMWYGRMTFRLKGKDPEAGRAETRAALLVVNALRNSQVDGRPALEAWADLYAPTVFFVGRSDDLTVVQYGDVMDYVYGQNPGLAAVADDARLDQFIQSAEQLPPPLILGIVIQVDDNEEQVTKGLRFMGQRFVPDAYIFRQLIYRNVGTQTHRRGLPKGMDLMAAMGSSRALQLLEQSGDTAYENYPQQMDKVKTWLSGLTVPDWTETLYNSWLYSFYPLLDVPGDGYPDFMRSTAWLDKQLNTSLGSWAELKHDTILYAKQVYAEMGGGPPPPPPLPPKGYVEPVPEFYARLAALTAMTRTGLESRGLLSDADRDGLGRLEDAARAFQMMAAKELRGEPLTEAEYERIRYFGGELEHLVILSADTDPTEQGVGNPSYMTDEQQAAVIADVATDPDPSGSGTSGPVVLQEGVGRINEIHAIVPIVDEAGHTNLQVTKGGVFSYYEFSWPANDRLTDEKWRGILDQGQAPPLPEWTGSFMVAEGEYAELGRAVHNYQLNIIQMYWDAPNAEYYLNPATEWLRPEMDALNAQRQYIGHQLVSSQVRSFDLQSPTQAVIVARETWLDKLYAYNEYPNYDEQPVGQRGPYVLDVTYQLQFKQGETNTYWDVTSAQYANQPPSW